MKFRIIIILVLLFTFGPIIGSACSMYKITKNGKTIVGNNEDWLSPNSLFWFESSQEGQYGVMYMGQLDRFAQGAINEAGLVFDGFANPELAIEKTEGKINIPIGEAIQRIMQTMSTVEAVKAYLSTINLSSLASSQLVFVDKSGSYLIVEGEELIIGEEQEKAFSNFYYSQIESEEEVELENFQQGLKFIRSSQGNSSMSYCSDVMKSLASSKLFGTQYSTIYDLSTLKLRIYLFHDYSQYIEFDLVEVLTKENHMVMIADLFPKESLGYQHYLKYNDEENPTKFLEELLGTSVDVSEKELQEMGFNSILHMVGYEWLNEKNHAEAAIKVFKYGTIIMPNDADLFDSLGEAYFENKDYKLAKVNFTKSLSLNPENKNAEAFLVKIDSKKDK